MPPAASAAASAGSATGAASRGPGGPGGPATVYPAVWRCLGFRGCVPAPAPESAFVMDLRECGNVGRFIRAVPTPQEANLVRVPVFVDTQDARLPRLALFAKRRLYPGEELLYCQSRF